jgi:hypothetical protein
MIYIVPIIRDSLGLAKMQMNTDRYRVPLHCALCALFIGVDVCSATLYSLWALDFRPSGGLHG